MNIWKIVSAISILIILIGGGSGINMLYNNFREQRDIEIEQQTIINVIQAINTNRAIPTFTNETGQIKLEWIPLEEICLDN